MDSGAIQAEGDPPSSWARWVRRGSAALADQGLFAIGNFILNVLLARSLTPREYGGFSVAFATFLLLSTLHTALLIEPMLVFGSGRYSGEVPTYFRSLLRLHWTISGSFTAVLLLLAALGSGLGGGPLVASWVAFAAMAPIILLTWLVRRAFYIILRPELAALGGCAYLATILIGLVFLRSHERLTPTTAILAMGAGSVISLATMIPALDLSFGQRSDRVAYLTIRNQHWAYGRWAFGTSVLDWVPSNLLLLVLPLHAGLAAAGAFRALLNLFVPMMQGISALGILSMPLLVRAWQRNPAVYSKPVRRLAIAFAGAGAAYGIAITTVARPVLEWVYDGKYLEYIPFVAVLATVPAFAGLTAIYGSALRAVERPELVFRGYLPPTIVTAALGSLLAYRYGVPGATWGWFLTYGGTAAALLLVYVRWSSRGTGAWEQRN